MEGLQVPGRANEEKLTGGNVTSVYRIGDTVRRELNPNSSKIHKLLKHLENKGFSYAPRFLGIDDNGREILTYIDGEAGNDPLKDYMWSNEALKEIARMLRQYHDAVSDFPMDDWEPLDNTPENPEVLCHNDFARYNIIFKDKVPAGIIDFDAAGPGPRIWDIAYTIYTCVPISRFHLSEAGEKVYYEPLLDATRIKQRVKLFFEIYGESIEEDFLEVLMQRLEGLCKTIKRKAAQGDAAFLKMIDDGHLELYQNDIMFIDNHGKDWI
ncbi:aminoglycoside phosphotransferase family protein [Bacillus salacetis]|uniref:Aminoglycoside phosphotransferase family protein n=1 Tax=Bacillus salacetis TaxID=2315464 RepID=A0A3A1QSI8_9BACI|nr:aminoglycoside phosphotransferase family protein [Bacillus salacetis]RIW28688.1 aminoglycoside phosphotransferase family protein [Bacillus salacetis]